MLGDDDELEYGAFDILSEAIEKQPAFLLLNYNQRNGSTAFQWENEKLYQNYLDCFKDNYNKMPYGTIVINLRCAQMISNKERERFRNTYHLYSGVLWDMALRNPKIIRIGKPLILKREREKKTYESYLKDVLLRAIPEWYDKLAEPYQKEAQIAKREHIINCFHNAKQEDKEYIVSSFQEYFQ